MKIPSLKPKKVAAHPFVAGYRELPVPANVPAITQLRGDLKAQMLLLAEHPTDEEYSANVPFSGIAARTYDYLMQQGEVSTDKHCLVMPFSRFGPKPNKASTQDTLPFLQSHLEHTKAKLIVVVGMTAFGFTFAGGRKTHARSIIGNPMYLPYVGRWVFVLPDTAQLLDLESGDFRAMQRAQEKAQHIVNLTLNLKKFAADKLDIHL